MKMAQFLLLVVYHITFYDSKLTLFNINNNQNRVIDLVHVKMLSAIKIKIMLYAVKLLD